MVYWKIIPDYPNYEVSNTGLVRNIKTGNLIKPEIQFKGYYRVQLYKNNKKRNYRIHRLVAEAFIDNPENKPHVNHKNLDKSNNCVENLEWVTWQENNRHYELLSLKT